MGQGHDSFKDFFAQLLANNQQWVSFSRYMALALFHPRYGYYEQAGTVIGPRGDFITAPMLGPLYAWACVGLAQRVFEQLGGGSVLEFGPGTGQLAYDFLMRAQALGCVPDRYWLCELSHVLQRKQADFLQTHLPEALWQRVSFCTPHALPACSGLVIANEVLDAFPASLFRFSGGQFYERGVSLSKHQLVFSDRLLVASDPLQQHLQQYDYPFPEGMVSEVHLGLSAWFKGLNQAFGRGVVLLVDYGFGRSQYYHAQRLQGTLMAHRQHRVSTDPLCEPGFWDLTAHVDFTAVIEAASAVGFQLAEFATQANWLQAQEIEVLYQQALATGMDKLALDRAVKLLMLPSEMGELFKVMLLAKDCALDLDLVSSSHLL
jgi:SAM-dependent MidA family methyltransferase